jgi:hypothetical protein
MNRKSFAALAIALPCILSAQQRAPLPIKFPAKPTAGAITSADLMSRLYIFADDSMMGRPAGTVYHDKGTDYIARELARLGLKPAGDNGTYFQQIPLIQRALAEGAKLTVDGRDFVVWRDFLPRDQGPTARAVQNATAVYGGVLGDSASAISPQLAAGKVVVFSVPRGWQSNRLGLTQRYLGAVAIVVASLDSIPVASQKALAEPTTRFDGSEPLPQIPPVPSFFYATRALAESMLGAPMQSLTSGASGKTLVGGYAFVERPSPGARNVIAILPGSDPALRGEYVAIGAHSDHIGFSAPNSDITLPVDHDSLYAFYHVVRPDGADDGVKPATPQDWPKVRSMLDSLRKVHTARADSIYNGADDDGSGSMTVLEVAEAFATAKDGPRRSILFVWHVAEEEGMLGSGYFTDHPTVPRDSIVGQINIDMVGRGPGAAAPGGGTGDLQLIGSRRLSTELGDIVDAEGKKLSPAIKFDYRYDANGHPGQYYCRSDHYMYARYGIPVVFMSTGGHPEYHQVTDEPQYIDYDGMARIAQLVYNTATHVANLDHRLVVDKPKPDPHGSCVQ